MLKKLFLLTCDIFYKFTIQHGENIAQQQQGQHILGQPGQLLGQQPGQLGQQQGQLGQQPGQLLGQQPGQVGQQPGQVGQQQGQVDQQEQHVGQDHGLLGQNLNPFGVPQQPQQPIVWDNWLVSLINELWHEISNNVVF